jgi:hypothetical protein
VAGGRLHDAGDGLGGRRDEYGPHSDDVPEARRAEAVVTPDGAEWAPRPRVDNAMVKALARAFRWRKMLDTGVHATIEDLARAKGVAPSYVSRVLRLTLLAPEIVECVLFWFGVGARRAPLWRLLRLCSRHRITKENEYGGQVL